MELKEYYDLLTTQFPSIIKNYQIQHTNELYLEVGLDQIVAICKFIHENTESPLISLFANDERKQTGQNFVIYYCFGLRDEGAFIILKTLVPEKRPVFPSLSKDIVAASLYEREIHDQFGLTPEGHPDSRNLVYHQNWPEDLYPLRKDFHIDHKPVMTKKETEFTTVQGNGVYEIPVGPVHAGIIEPGHFRFSVAGEPIINLEAQLYYVHKGIEKLCEGQSIEKCLYIAERISGDETYTNSLAYCQALEKIAGVTLPQRAEYSRVIFAELERLVNHFGDLGGICVDVAYGFAAFQFRMLRIWTFQIIEEIANSRFLRSVNRPGGLRKDFLAGNEQKLLDALQKIKRELEETVQIIRMNSLFIDRVEHTGILEHRIAVDLNAVGPAGRAAGIKYDVRKSMPYAAYGKLEFQVPDHHNGDVNCRINIKIEECFTAIELITQAIQNLPEGEIIIPLGNLESGQYAFGYTESPRGENIHWVMTGPQNTIFRYKVRTPSFCNWPALCYAVRGNIVPDFPLINKSFNLSYAGNDL